MLNILRYLRATYHYILFVDTALWESRREQAQGFEQLQNKVCQLMQQVLLHMKALLDGVSQEVFAVMMTELAQAIEKTDAQCNTFCLSAQDQKRQAAIFFTARRMRVCLHEYANSWHEISIAQS
jgi:hypothetical protein